MSATDQRSVVFFLVPNFSMIAFTSAIEPLRLANRMLGRECYTWRLASSDGEPVTASNGVPVMVTSSLDKERHNLSGSRRPSILFLCSGVFVERYENKSLFAYLRETRNSGVTVGGLCTAAYLLAAAGLLNGKRCAIHWENLPGFSEKFPTADVYADLYEKDGNIWTCAGGTAALDMMLSLIGEDHDDDLVNRV
ncbi:MAG: AraC family transcriptional regulator, partial [Nitratireductor sp.]|nr:AraC family transcriptional regulator [Nitratireductor sp.]